MTKRPFQEFPTLKQPKQGYRYGIDSFLLARFAKVKASENLCDLGSGVGILGLLALSRGKAKHVVALEVQQDLARLALDNAEILGVREHYEVLHANWKDAKKLLKPKRFNVVISNPPYRKLQTGKVPPENSKAISKHEILGTMRDLIETAAFLVKPSGRFLAMYPPLRLEELVEELAQAKFKIQRMGFIHPYPDRSATLVMVEAVRSLHRELLVEAPVIVYRDPDHYTPEVEAWVGPKRRN